MEGIRIVKENDFYLRIPIRKLVFSYDENGKEVRTGQRMNLCDCTDLAVSLFWCAEECSKPTTYYIAEHDESQLIVKVNGKDLPLGWYGVDITGTCNGNSIRSFERKVFKIVKSNGDSNVSTSIFNGEVSYPVDSMWTLYTKPTDSEIKRTDVKTIGFNGNTYTPDRDGHIQLPYYATRYCGTIEGSSETEYGTLTPAAHSGSVYKVSVNGIINGENVYIGDELICHYDNTEAATPDNYSAILARWEIIHKNNDGSVISPESSVDGNVPMFVGASGKVVKDSGIHVRDLATKVFVSDITAISVQYLDKLQAGDVVVHQLGSKDFAYVVAKKDDTQGELSLVYTDHAVCDEVYYEKEDNVWTYNSRFSIDIGSVNDIKEACTWD